MESLLVLQVHCRDKRKKRRKRERERNHMCVADEASNWKRLKRIRKKLDITQHFLSMRRERKMFPSVQEWKTGNSVVNVTDRYVSNHAPNPKNNFIPLVFYTCGRAVVHILKWDQNSAKTTLCVLGPVFAHVSSSSRSCAETQGTSYIKALSSYLTDSHCCLVNLKQSLDRNCCCCSAEVSLNLLD